MNVHSQSWQWLLRAANVENDARTALIGLADAHASQEALSAEAMRIALWAQCRLSGHSTIQESAVTTRDVLRQARALLLPFFAVETADTEADDEQAQRDDDSPTMTFAPNRTLLDLLTDQGDIQPLAGGHWIPTPLRLVPIMDSQFTLLVGGLPTHEFPSDIQRSLDLFGNVRRLDGARLGFDRDAFAALLQAPIQPLNQWLGPTPPTREALLEHMRTTPQTAVDKDASDTEVYMPDVEKPQGLRWIPLRQTPRDGRYLLRQRTKWGSPRFSVGKIHLGELGAQSDLIPGGDVRRLQYALDWQARMPTNAKWSPQRGTLVLESELPARERKLLSMLGTLAVNAEHYYPRRWTQLPVASAEPIEQMLTDLGVNIIRI